MSLVNPHGKDKRLKPLLLEGAELAETKRKAQTLPRLTITSRETSDLIMLGIGAFTPLDGFMGEADWRGVCDAYRLADGTFWPIPITLSTAREEAGRLTEGREVALVDGETGDLMATLTVREKYTIDRAHECTQVFRTTDPAHPGVATVMGQGEVNLAGPVKVLGEGPYPDRYPGLYMRPAETRRAFEAKGWSTVAALQLRNPMHRSHEYLAKIAVEICDGVLIQQILGKLKPGDIPAEVRVRAVDTLVRHYFVKDTCIQAGVPLEMRYGGPREALLHAVFRQNFGCSYLLVGRDHAGVGEYYGPFDAQKIFDEIPPGSLELRPLKIDMTFYCGRCDGMATGRTCPHGTDDRVAVSGTMLRKTLSEGGQVPDHFSRPEVLAILQEYYAQLAERVEVKLHKYARGEQ
ncbi:MAG: sulfate adenylyltransferase [Candidatus Rokubacteria bacterium]|nr:sulfate adenylyltransferase [Candidatus Rokubacteria bacterium]MBI2157061.1 sulfate adenylyltransferase [Candidatus Rokubacteria bacterium]